MPVYGMVQAALGAGITFIQHRDKARTRRELFEEAVGLRELTRSYNALLIINDHADLALAVGADGVHLGQDDLPLSEARKIMGKRIIGISTHDLSQAEEAEAGGADYIGFGPIFHTTTKDAGPPRGLDNLRLITQNVRVPVVAIGGINADNITAVMDSGASAVAVATAVCRGDVTLNVLRLTERLKG